MANPTQEVLMRLGLTQYGARAYEALTGLGPSPADAVAEAAQIPRTKTYAVLDELVEKEWASADDGRPRTYVRRFHGSQGIVESTRGNGGLFVDDARAVVGAGKTRRHGSQCF